MTLVLARCLEDPQALWQELEDHWQRGSLVGLAPPQDHTLLLVAVLGEAAHARAGGGRSSPPQALAPSAPDPATAAAPHRRSEIPPCSGDPMQSVATWAPALVLGSGGSSGGRRWCLQPLAHLQASARACGNWLTSLGIDPGRCLHLNALPLHHVSGLMPLIRAREWGAELRWLPPELLRRPGRLAQACPLPDGRPVLLSLVPTQLRRLLDSPEAVDWLRQCALIWVGGAALGPDLAARAREAGLPLAPCYGATETAAMICALPPQRFLAGEPGCGPALEDVELRLEGGSGALAVRCGRLSPGWFTAGQLQPFRDADGWWRSGDAGLWQPAMQPADRPGSGARGCAGEGAPAAPTTDGTLPAPGASLVILGRLDGAIHSGGETVFPDQVRQRLLELIRQQELPVAELLVLAEPDALWGERLVALVRWRTALGSGASPAANGDPGGDPQTPWLVRLADLAGALPPPQRPRRWLSCPELEANLTGKWEQQRWRDWLKTHDATA